MLYSKGDAVNTSFSLMLVGHIANFLFAYLTSFIYVAFCCSEPYYHLCTHSARSHLRFGREINPRSVTFT